MRMNSRFHTRSELLQARLKLTALRGLLRPLVRWPRGGANEEGYTLIVGCASALPDVLLTNLTMLQRLDHAHLREIICVFDCPKNQLPAGFVHELRSQFKHLRIRPVFYSRLQASIARRVGWGWVYSWLSWSVGIRHTKTRLAFLHDYDAMPLRPDFFEQRYRVMQARACAYLGVEAYRFGEFREDDQLVVTPEMGFDAAFVRKTFKPIDLFNHIGWYHGRCVHFDTFLAAQTRAGSRTVMQMQPGDLVHPAQMLCQFTALQHRSDYVPPQRNTMLVVPYYQFVAGREAPLFETTRALQNAPGTRIPFFGRTMDLRELSAEQVRSLCNLIDDMEHALVGYVRPAVQLYLSAMMTFVADRSADLQPTPARAAA